MLDLVDGCGLGAGFSAVVFEQLLGRLQTIRDVR